MNIEKLTSALYDFLGYILTGSIGLFALAVLDRTFCGGNSLSLYRFSAHPGGSTVLAYCAGVVSHALAGWLKNRCRNVRFFGREWGWANRLMSDEGARLGSRLPQRVQAEIADFYALDRSEGEFSTLERYQLSEAYLAVSGGYADRDVYMAHEGFAKSARVSLLFLTAVLLAAGGAGGAMIRITGGSGGGSRWVTWFASVGCLILTNIFRARFLFFNRLKNNFTQLAFLAHRQKEKAAPKP